MFKYSTKKIRGPPVLSSICDERYSKLLFKRPKEHLECTVPLSRKQYGFISGRSTEYAAVDLVRFVKASMSKYAPGIVLDVKGTLVAGIIAGTPEPLKPGQSLLYDRLFSKGPKCHPGIRSRGG